MKWESQRKSKPETIEGTILHDAHLIEGGKTFLIIKSLVKGASRGQTLEETISFIEQNILRKYMCESGVEIKRSFSKPKNELLEKRDLICNS